ncbi:hypothetical protein [Paraburkholderia sp. C35]|uniref:hypothetical protein n=1 Tax=Paraburkholderia sp. C35 TaxID=2126993 RepID=UPI0013A533E1|nr:hypothetical protein [Paraburkholderia sp. C35]
MKNFVLVTHHTRAVDGCEFSNDAPLVRFPVVIMAWQRLRQEHGLDNPAIDHPLMQPDYVRFPDPMRFYSDDLLEAALARLRREEMPEIGAVRRPGFVANGERPSLLKRLFRR